MTPNEFTLTKTGFTGLEVMIKSHVVANGLYSSALGM